MQTSLIERVLGLTRSYLSSETPITPAISDSPNSQDSNRNADLREVISLGERIGDLPTTGHGQVSAKADFVQVHSNQ